MTEIDDIFRDLNSLADMPADLTLRELIENFDLANDPFVSPADYDADMARVVGIVVSSHVATSAPEFDMQQLIGELFDAVESYEQFPFESDRRC